MRKDKIIGLIEDRLLTLDDQYSDYLASWASDTDVTHSRYYVGCMNIINEEVTYLQRLKKVIEKVI